MQEVNVTSHYKETLTDHHRGMKFVFEPAKKTTIPVAAAVHIFGLNLKDKAPAYRRHGFTNDKDGLAFLNKFTLDVVELVPADSGQSELLEENAKLKERLAELEEAAKEPEKKGKKKEQEKE